jgi:hypothetical protein
MPQASGSAARFTYVEESAWGTTPGSPTMKALAAAVYGESFGGSIDELRSNAISASRAVQGVRGGPIGVQGSIPIELPWLGIGTILKGVLGGKTTTGAGPYTHVLKRAATVPSFSIEKGFTDIGQYIVMRGCKMNSLSIALDPTALVTGTLTLQGKDQTASGTALGTPAALTHTPFAVWEGAAQEGGSAATIVGANFTITNNLNGPRQVGSRYIGALTEGQGEATGDVQLLFQDLTAYNKWANETQSSLKFTFTNGPNSVEFNFPKVIYTGDATPKIANAQGVLVPLQFRGVYDGTALSDVVITIINTEATI